MTAPSFFIFLFFGTEKQANQDRRPRRGAASGDVVPLVDGEGVIV